MKILFLSDNFPPETNAAATRVYERALHWAKWGHDVTVITSFPNFPQGAIYPGYENQWYSVEEKDGIRVVRVKTFISANRGTLLRSLDFLSFLFTALPAALVQPRFDVVAATSPQFFAAVAGWLTGFLRRVPFVFELGDIWPASIIGVGVMQRNIGLIVLEKIELFLYRRAASVVALTNAFKVNLISRGINPAKITVVRNGVDLFRYAPRERDTELARSWGLSDRFVIGYVGTHGMAHDLINVVEAAERLRHRPDICFLLVGDGAERPMLVEEARRRGLTNIVLQGPQPKEMMPRIWSLCDVALVHLKDSPVFAEVIPSKIFEAMGMGLPLLLASPPGEAQEIVQEDRAGLWVKAGDPDALAAMAVRMKDEAELFHELARNSHAAAASHSRRVQAVEMLQALELSAAGRGGTVGSRPI
ncbi:MAG: glycosyltransferase family 4 protein [Phaeospirillum sp.]|nr:glycosyltransferase family 4 protein [Phaeospirillum sp.]